MTLDGDDNLKDREAIEVRIIELLSGDLNEAEEAELMQYVKNDDSIRAFYEETKEAITSMDKAISKPQEKASEGDWKLPASMRKKIEDLYQGESDVSESLLNEDYDIKHYESSMVEMLSGGVEGYEKKDLMAHINASNELQKSYNNLENLVGKIEVCLDFEDIKRVHPSWKLSAERRAVIDELIASEKTAAASGHSVYRKFAMYSGMMASIIAACVVVVVGLKFKFFDSAPEADSIAPVAMLSDHELSDSGPEDLMTKVPAVIEQREGSAVEAQLKKTEVVVQKPALPPSALEESAPLVAGQVRPKILIDAEDNIIRDGERQFVAVSRIVSEGLNKQLLESIEILRKQKEQLVHLNDEIDREPEIDRRNELLSRRDRLWKLYLANNEYSMDKFSYVNSRNFMSVIENSNLYRMISLPELEQLKMQEPDKDWGALVRQEGDHYLLHARSISGKEENETFRNYFDVLKDQLAQKAEHSELVAEIRQQKEAGAVLDVEQEAYLGWYNELNESIAQNEAFLYENFAVTVQGGFRQSIVSMRLYAEVKADELVRLPTEGHSLLFNGLELM